MRVKVITLRYAPSLGGFDERPLAEFVRDKEVLAVREHFFTVHDLPHLACLLTWQPPAPSEDDGGEPRTGRGRRRKDPARDLGEAERPLFETLRAWRAERARKEGVPPYMLFTNRELVAIVRARPRTPNALQALEGIGPAKVERYGRALLDLVAPEENDGGEEPT